MSGQKCLNDLVHLDWCSIGGQGGFDNLVRLEEGRDEHEQAESDHRTNGQKQSSKRGWLTRNDQTKNETNYGHGRDTEDWVHFLSGSQSHLYRQVLCTFLMSPFKRYSLSYRR